TKSYRLDVNWGVPPRWHLSVRCELVTRAERRAWIRAHAQNCEACESGRGIRGASFDATPGRGKSGSRTECRMATAWDEASDRFPGVEGGSPVATVAARDASKPAAPFWNESLRVWLFKNFFTNLCGVTFRDWWETLRENRFAIDPPYWPR